MLTFDPVTHSYRYEGRPVPGVTQILKPLYDFGGIPPDVLAAKARLGQHVHLATEMDDDGELDDASCDEVVLGYVKGWRQFKADRGPAILASEQRVFSLEHQYAGTLDRIVGMDGSEWVLDIKTSAEIHPAVGPQTMAYSAASGHQGLRRCVVQLRMDGTYTFKELTNPKDWVVFQACKLIHRFKMEHRLV